MAALLAVTTVISLSATATTPAGAAPAAFTLDMIGGQGRVILGKSPDAPLVIDTPSTITGTVDDQTGAITGGSLSTPPIRFTQQITDPVEADVDITATFSDTSPNSGTGQVDGLGNVRFTTSLDLALHIDVGGGLLTGDCTSAPITLELLSIDPYDPDLGEVTLSDTAFAIPPVEVSPTCPALLTGPINDQLAAPNNAITLGLVGALPLPPPPGEPSETALVADATSVPMGREVTFTATITPPGATGTVTFLSGHTSLGVKTIDEGGVATLSTSSLPVGTHTITAAYSGDLDHRPSTSNPVMVNVTAIPNVTATLPGHLVLGATPTEFTATISNPVGGQDEGSLRLDMLYGRVGASAALNATHLTLERQDGDAWVPVPLARRTTPAPADPTGTLAGSYGGTTGFALDAGASRTVTFRLAAAANAPEGSMAVAFSLVTVDGEGAVVSTVTQQTASIAVVGASPRPTTVEVTSMPTDIRQGFLVNLSSRVTRTGATPLPSMTGLAEILIDGSPVVARKDAQSPTATRLAVGSTGTLNVQILPDATRQLAPGTHRVAVRFLGDLSYAPSLSPEVTFTVHGQAQPAYECAMVLAVLALPMGARMGANGVWPAAAPAGSTVSPGALSLRAVVENNPNLPLAMLPGVFLDPTVTLTPIIDLSVGGASGTYEGISVEMPPAPTAIQEGTVIFEDPTVEVPIEGEPGDVVEIRLERVGFEAESGGVPVTYTCEAVDESLLLGSVTVAGTVLSSSAVGVVEEGSSVLLSASVFPSSAQGMVEFFDGSTSLGFAPVSGGEASLPTSVLPRGRRSVSARYLGDLVNAPSSSEPVEVVVRDVILCKNQTGTESGAVVRATYLSLLGRCAEPSGFAFWRGRLDGGLSAEVFAGQIANTLEAHGRSVDDGYGLILGRTPDAGGRAFWAQRLDAGQRYDLLLGDLAASREFWTAAGSTNSGYVTRLYDRLLHRAPDSAGLSYWVGRLDAGASRASVAASFVRLPEPSGQIVADAYQAILDRNPTGTEKAPAVTAFQANGQRWRVYASLIGTGEFHDRAQSFPNG